MHPAQLIVPNGAAPASAGALSNAAPAEGAAAFAAVLSGAQMERLRIDASGDGSAPGRPKDAQVQASTGGLGANILLQSGRKAGADETSASPAATASAAGSTALGALVGEAAEKGTQPVGTSSPLEGAAPQQGKAPQEGKAQNPSDAGPKNGAGTTTASQPQEARSAAAGKSAASRTAASDGPMPPTTAETKTADSGPSAGRQSEKDGGSARPARGTSTTEARTPTPASTSAQGSGTQGSGTQGAAPQARPSGEPERPPGASTPKPAAPDADRAGAAAGSGEARTSAAPDAAKAHLVQEPAGSAAPSRPPQANGDVDARAAALDKLRHDPSSDARTHARGASRPTDEKGHAPAARSAQSRGPRPTAPLVSEATAKTPVPAADATPKPLVAPSEADAAASDAVMRAAVRDVQAGRDGAATRSLSMEGKAQREGEKTNGEVRLTSAEGGKADRAATQNARGQRHQHGRSGGESSEDARPSTPSQANSDSTSTTPFQLRAAAADAEKNTKPSPMPTPADTARGDAARDDAEAPQTTNASDKSDKTPSKASGERARTARGGGSRRALPNAWLKAVSQGPLRVSTLTGGWKSVELVLGEEDGTVTVQARSDQEKVAVSVGFSESRLRTQAMANARQLQDAMQAQYDTEVDLSFAGGNAGESGERGSEDADGSPASTPLAASASPDDPAADEPARGGLRHEWIG